MSHLGDRLSALVDGELDGAERDKATTHLARCEQCRAEAASLRDLKRQLRSLAADWPAVAAAEVDMTRRLMEMTGIGGTQPRRRLRALARPGLSRPPIRIRPPGPGGKQRPQGMGISRRPRRYLVFGTMSIVVSLGTAAFTAGGGNDGSPGPKITPPMELYSEQHAITTGEVPFTGVPGTVETGPGSFGTSSMSTTLPTAPPASKAPGSARSVSKPLGPTPLGPNREAKRVHATILRWP